MTNDVLVQLCGPCLAAGSSDARGQVADALAAAGISANVRVGDAPCLGPCAEPLALALQGEGRGAYVFAGVSLPADLDDLVATCQAYMDAPGGWIVDARPCGRLRYCLRTRVPAMGF